MRQHFKKACSVLLACCMLMQGVAFAVDTPQTENQKRISFAYPNFSSEALNSQLRLSGQNGGKPVTQADGSLYLTPTDIRGGANTNAVYYGQKLGLADDYSFSTYFVISCTQARENEVPAEGFAFTLTAASNDITDAAYGGTLCMGPSNTSQTLWVELDTYDNGGGYQDPGNVGQHLALGYDGIYHRGGVAQSLTNNGINMTDTQKKYVWVDYNGADKKLTATVSNSTDRTAGVSMDISDLSLDGILKTKDVYVGITSQEWNHQVLGSLYSWYFDAQYNPIDAPSMETEPYFNGPASISVTADPATGVETSAPVTVKALDYQGNPVANTAIRLTTDYGSFSSTEKLMQTILVTDANGEASATFYNSSYLAGYAHLNARSDEGVLGSLTIECASLKDHDPMISFLFSSFTDNGAMKLSSANQEVTPAIQDGVINLTPDTNGYQSAAYFNRKIRLGDDRSFSSYFRMKSGGTGAGDGYSFVLTNNSNDMKSNYGDVGSTGEPRVRGALSVEFDTYINENGENGDTQDGRDRMDSHLALNLEGNYHSGGEMYLSGTDIPRLNDGTPKDVWVDYNGGDQILTVTVQDTADTSKKVIWTQANVDLSAVLTSPDVYVGLTGRSWNQTNEIQAFCFDNQYQAIRLDSGKPYISAPAQVTVTPASDNVRQDTRLDLAVTDYNGQPINNITLDLSTSLPGTTVEPASIATDVNGKASVTLRNTGAVEGTAVISAVSNGGIFDTAAVQCVPGGKQSYDISLAYPNFSATTPLHESQIRLTANGMNQQSSAFYKDKITLDANRAFSTFFTISMSGGSVNPGEGFAFVLSNDHQISTSCGAMGFGNFQTNSAAVEFDIYYNQDVGDPSDNHIGLDFNGDAHSIQPQAFDKVRIADKQDKYIWIDYDGSTLTVSISNTNRRYDAETKTITDVRLNEVLASPDVYVGFTGSTIGAYIEENLDSWYFQNACQPIDLYDGNYSASSFSGEGSMRVLHNFIGHFTVDAKAEAGGTAEVTEGAGAGLEGRDVVVKATPDEGYRFAGWYDDDNGSLLSTEETYKFFIYKHPTNLTAKFSKLPTGMVSISSTNSGTFRVKVGGEAQQDPAAAFSGEFLLGTAVQVTAVEEAQGPVFLYWMDENNNILSKNSVLEFHVTGAITCKAVFNPAPTTEQEMRTVTFTNNNGQVYQSNTYDAKTVTVSDIQIPATFPSRYGYTAVSWDKSPQQILSSLQAGMNVKVKPVYVKVEVFYAVTVSGGTIVTAPGAEGKFEGMSLVTVLADAPQAGMKFSHWELDDGTAVGMTAQYEFFAVSDIHLNAVFVAENAQAEEGAAVRIAQTVINAADRKISFVAEHFVSEGYTMLGHGVILTKDSAVGNDMSAFVLDGANVINGRANTTGTWGLFTVNINQASKTWYARGYVTVQDKDGNIFTVYSDAATATME